MAKVAAITGASKGIGLAITEMLLTSGWEVYGISRSGQGPSNANFHGIVFDLSRVGEIAQLTSQLPPKIDLLINNAGHWPDTNVEQITLDAIENTLHLNFFAPVLLISGLINRIPKGATIINITSVMALVTDPGCSLYSASKSALDRVTTTLAKERPDLVVVSVMPSGTNTPGLRASQDDTEGMLKPEQIAKVVEDVLKGKYKSGSLIPIINIRSRDWWKTHDKYDHVVDFSDS